MKRTIPSMDNIPVSLCRSTLVMRIDNNSAPKFYQPLAPRCMSTEPCVQVLLPQSPKSNVFRKKARKNSALYTMLFASAAIITWLFLHVIIMTRVSF
jgi:hypothetical protein